HVPDDDVVGADDDLAATHADAVARRALAVEGEVGLANGEWGVERDEAGHRKHDRPRPRSGDRRAEAAGPVIRQRGVGDVARGGALVWWVAAEGEGRGRKTMRITSDVGDEASLAAMRDAVIAQFGRVDIALCAAGITRRAPTLEMDTAEWQQIVDVNLMGTLRAFKAFAPPMIARRSGRLIGVASLSSFVGLHEVSAYTASKSAVAGLTRALAIEWAPHGLTVNAIAPGV